MNTNSSTAEFNELPKYFAIKRDANNPLWNKYIEWLNKTYNIHLSGEVDFFYGFSGSYLPGSFFHSDTIYFPNPVTVLTLEQWDNIVNKKDEFVLPKEWIIKVTDQNKGIINSWKQKIKPDSEEAGLYNQYTNYKGYNDYLKPKYTEITFKQFKKYVLKEENCENIETNKYNPITDDEFIVNCTNNSKYEKMKVYEFLIKNRNYPELYLNNEANFIACNKEYGDTNWNYLTNAKNKFPNHPVYSFEEFKNKYLNVKTFGYVLSKPEYKEAVKTILNAPQFPLNTSQKSCDFKIDSEWYFILKEAGVLNLWFQPVYENEKELPNVNGYKGEFVSDLNADFIKYGCAKFNVQYIKELHGLIDRNKALFGNKDIKSIKLDSNVEITIEQIKQIYEYISEHETSKK